MTHNLSEQQLSTFYTICSALRYNSERIAQIEDVLRNYLVHLPEQFNMRDEIKKTRFARLKGLNPEDMFMAQDVLLSLDVDWESALDYVNKRYSLFEEPFQKKYGFDTQLISLIPAIIMQLVT